MTNVASTCPCDQLAIHLICVAVILMCIALFLFQFLFRKRLLKKKKKVDGVTPDATAPAGSSKTIQNNQAAAAAELNAVVAIDGADKEGAFSDQYSAVEEFYRPPKDTYSWNTSRTTALPNEPSSLLHVRTQSLSNPPSQNTGSPPGQVWGSLLQG